MSVNDLSIYDKQQIKKTLSDLIQHLPNDPDYPIPDLGEGILKYWSKDMTNYYEFIDAYLKRNKSDKPINERVVNIVLEGIFPYIMAFQEFFTSYHIEDNVTEQCDKNNFDETDNTKRIGQLLLDNLQNGATFKLSDDYCYDLMELYGIQPSNKRFISPFTREEFDITEQVFLTILKSLNTNQISRLNDNSSVAGMKKNKRNKTKRKRKRKRKSVRKNNKAILKKRRRATRKRK
tara:strand:+ start:43 stop:744 length:702 start_codon:yes stop_codon:yes gene_type:complete